MSRDPQRQAVYAAERDDATLWNAHLLLDLHPHGRCRLPGQTGSGWRRSEASPEQWARFQAEAAYRRTIANRVKSFAAAIMAHPNWQAIGGPADVDVRLAQRGAVASRGGWYSKGWGIRIAVPAVTPRVIAHELAHVSVMHRLGDFAVGREVAMDDPGHLAGHGPDWARDALVLYGTIYGNKGRDRVAARYLKRGVQFEPFHEFPTDNVFARWASANMSSLAWRNRAGLTAAAARAASPN